MFAEDVKLTTRKELNMSKNKSNELRNAIQSIKDVPALSQSTKDIVIKALELQIPEHPACRQEGDPPLVRRYYCPRCRAYFGSRAVNANPLFRQPAYCDCGQAIDWTDDRDAGK